LSLSVGCWWVCGVYKHRGPVREWADHRCRWEGWRRAYDPVLWPSLGHRHGRPGTTLPQGSADQRYIR